MKKVLIFIILMILIGCNNHTHKIKNAESQKESSPVKQINYKKDSDMTIIDSTIHVEAKNSKTEKDQHANNKKEIISNITLNFVTEFDISSMMLDTLFGAFGNNFQRINLMIKSIKKSESPEKYLVEGCTVMKNKEVNYKGEIDLKNVSESNFNPYNFSDSTNFTIEISASYNFVEDKTNLGYGIFNGNLRFTLVLDKENKLHNDLWEWWGDGYSNFQYQGTWTSDKGDKFKCIFGDGRLENSGDLDVGDGSFVPNEKYYKYGWADYFDQL